MLRRIIDLVRDLRAQRGEIDALRRAVDGLTAALRGELATTNRTLLELSTFVREQLSSPEAVAELTKSGWRRAEPTVALTWNTEMTGDEFLGHVAAACGTTFGRIVEIGPGYGRVLRTLLASDVRFDAYHGLDISPENAKHLGATFTDPRVRFTNVDFLTHRVETPVDLVYSSAVFLHLYPSIAPALAWSHAALGAGGHLCFDVPQGRLRYVDAAWGLFVRQYEERELRDLVAAAGFASCHVVEEREFAPGTLGWFVAAQKARA